MIRQEVYGLLGVDQTVHALMHAGGGAALVERITMALHRRTPDPRRGCRG